MFDSFGPVIALLTPFDKKGRIDWGVFRTYLTELSSWGVGKVICNGSTGEFPSLTGTERQRVVEFVRKHFEGIIINNVSSTCFEVARRLIDGTRENADAVLLLPPYYYSNVDQAGLCDFFAKVLSITEIPAFLYNFPQYAGNRIDNDLLHRLQKKGVIISGIKDSSGSLKNALTYHSEFPDMKILFANDSEALRALHLGIEDLVSGGANPLPEFLQTMQQVFHQSESSAQRLQNCFDIWNDFRTNSGLFEIPLLKAAMGARIPNFPIHVRPPFTAVSADSAVLVRSVIGQCRHEFNALLRAEK